MKLSNINLRQASAEWVYQRYDPSWAGNPNHERTDGLKTHAMSCNICTAHSNASLILSIQGPIKQHALSIFRLRSYLVVEITHTPFPSVSALMHTPPFLPQSCEQTEVLPLGVDVLSAIKFHTNLEMSSTWLG